MNFAEEYVMLWNKFMINDVVFIIQDSRFKIQDSRFKILRFKIQQL